MRDISFHTQVFEQYSRVEKALENAIIESYLHGVSKRKIQKVISTLGVEKISDLYFSSIAKELDSKVIEFLSRPIESHIPYLFVDASYFKIRDDIRYASEALLVIAGIREDGIREILGARIADCEDELTWEDLFSDLKDRGLQHVDMVISDGHKGIRTAVQRSFHGTSWQMCQCDKQVGGVDCVMPSYPFRTSLPQRADLVTDWCEACGTTWMRKET